MQKKLKNGYYLSTYCCIDPIFNILKLGFRHDQNISLWYINNQDVQLIHHWELERITGIKHHKVSFLNKEEFLEFVEILLKQYNLTLADIEEIIGTPEVSTVDDYHNLVEYETITYHSIAHLYSSMLSDSDIFFNENILSLAVDGAPDIVVDKTARRKNLYIGAVSKKGQVQYCTVPSPGIYWMAATSKFKIAEGTLMALAYASESKSLEIIPNVDDIFDVYTYSDAIKIDEYITRLYNKFAAYTEMDQGIKFNYFDERFSKEDNVMSMVMKVIQEISILKTEKTIDRIIQEYDINPKETYLSFSGGYTLNCPTNTHIIHKSGFKDQLFIPCVNDGGLAIGIGLYYFHKKMSKFNFKFENSYYGDEDINLESALTKFREFINSVKYNDDQFVLDLTNSPLVWFDGRAEVGPRALGHRSILADPRKNESKDLLNIYKQRQWWRPVAPIILEEHLEDWFEDSFKTSFMLNNFKLREDKIDIVPAVIHLDNTSRVQSINETEDKRLYNCIVRFYEETNVPIICNTSLNDKGEPIINTITQALNFALRKGIKIVYVNGNRLELKNHEDFKETEPEKRNDNIFTKNFNNTNLLKKYNPHGLTSMEYYIYMMNESLREYDINELEDVKEIKLLVERLNKKYKFNLYTNIF